MIGLNKQALLSNSGLLGFFFTLRKAYLTKSKRTHYSQYGEDIILADWIKNKRDGLYVDVGCYHPKKYSNTYLLHKKGWNGVNVDLNQLKIKAFNMLRPNDHNVVAAVSDQETEMEIFHDGVYSLGATLNKSFSEQSPDELLKVEKIKTRTLNSIMEQSPFSKQEIDLLSIDAEGHDFEVLRSIDLQRYKPKIVIIEKHSPNIDGILQSDIYKYLHEQGYKLANWVGYSLFFVSPHCDFMKKHLA